MSDLFDLENTVSKVRQKILLKTADSLSSAKSSYSQQNNLDNRLLALQQELTKSQFRKEHVKAHNSSSLAGQLSVVESHGKIVSYANGKGTIKDDNFKQPRKTLTVKFTDKNISRNAIDSKESLIKKGTEVNYQINTAKFRTDISDSTEVVGKSLDFRNRVLQQHNGTIILHPRNQRNGKIKQDGNGLLITFTWDNIDPNGALHGLTKRHIRKYTKVRYSTDNIFPNKVAGQTLNTQGGNHDVAIQLIRHGQLEQYLRDSQRVGFELECADLYLKGVKGVTDDDTYGIPIIQTTTFSSVVDEGLSNVSANRLPVIKVVLEERKSGADPHIEVVTAPFHNRGLLRTLKNYIANHILSSAHGRTAANWAAAIQRQQISTLYTSPVPPTVGVSAQANLAWQRHPQYPGIFNDLKLTKKESGARLIQCNVDVSLEQFYIAPDFIRSMIVGRDHLKFYNAAWQIVDDWKHTYQHLLRPNDSRHHVAGLLTYALYQAFAARAYGGNSKEFVQPLIKCGVDVLARVGLDAVERGLLLDVASFVVNGYDAATSALTVAPLGGALAIQTARANELMDPLNQGLKRAFAVDDDGLEKDDLEGPLDYVRFALMTWFLVQQEVTKIIYNNHDRINANSLVSLYPGGPPMNEQTTDAGTNDNRDFDNWIDNLLITDQDGNDFDLYNSSFRVRTLGDSVDWRGKKKGGDTTAGTPLKPRLDNSVVPNKTIVVVEVRKSEANFNKRIYHDNV